MKLLVTVALNKQKVQTKDKNKSGKQNE